ncbi:MAG: radical SAM protein [Candidatus Omnitrophota bacterium]
MSDSFASSVSLSEFYLWEKFENKRELISFDLELTARCNNNCRHCYINLPAQDKKAKENELSLGQIKDIADQAVSLGALWCLITGGEPLLRKDFFEIYLYLKKKGLLISVFTNATLVNESHIKLFKKYPARNIEVTVYGVTRQTYERITRQSGSFKAFMRGLDLLLKNGIKVRFKTMALRSNAHELPKIAQFCRQRTKDHFRFDPFLNLRFDSNQSRNGEIKSERLSAEEIVVIEQADLQRFAALEKGCDKLILPEFSHKSCNHLFSCGAGTTNFSVGYDGFLRPCHSLLHSECKYSLKNGNLTDAWQNFIPRVRDLRSNSEEFLNNCKTCSLINLCLWCPATSYLETGYLDRPVEYFCEVAHARAQMLSRNAKFAYK